jgi:hypothetical protein
VAPIPTLRRARLTLLLAALLPAGCNVNDYAGRMASESERLRAWDDDTKALGDPIKMPDLPKKGKTEEIWNIFLRLPHDVTETPVTIPKSSLAQLYGGCAQYQGSTSDRYGFQNVYVGSSDIKKDPNFVASALAQFGLSPGGEATITLRRNANLMNGAPPGMPPDVTVKRKEAASAQSEYSFNFYEVGDTMVTVVYQVQKGKLPSAKPVIDKSLATLGAEAEWGVLYKAYTRQNSRSAKR